MSSERKSAPHGETEKSEFISAQEDIETTPQIAGIDIPAIDNSLKAGELTLEEGSAGGIGRHLGLVSTTLLIIGRIIGSGIFSTPSSITESVGSVGAAFMVWLFAFFLSLAGLFVWLEFGCMFPRSGGEKVYLEAAYRQPRSLITIVYASYTVLLGFSATGCISFAANILNAIKPGLDKTGNEWLRRGIAISAISAVVICHAFTPKLGVRIMNVLSTLKIFTLVFIIISGLIVLSGKVHKVPDPRASFRESFKGSKRNLNSYVTALLKATFSFGGWHNAAYVLNEVKRPVHTLKISGPLALAVCGLLYMLANVSYYAAATPKEISKSGITVAGFFMGRVFNRNAERALSVLVALSSLGALMTGTFTHSRVNQELAKEGIIPYGTFWASAWPVGAPAAGLLLHFLPSVIVLVAIPFGDSFNFIINVEQYARAVVFFAVVIGLFVLRWKNPGGSRPFKVWYSVAAFFAAGQLTTLVIPFVRPPGGKGDTSLPYWLYPIVALCVFVFGAIYWALWRRVLPKLGKYSLEEKKLVLEDGTVVVSFTKKAE